MKLALQALADLHEAGLAHCDWKPDNLVLQRQPNGNVLCKPIDFGFARICRGQSPLVTQNSQSLVMPVFEQALSTNWMASYALIPSKQEGTFCAGALAKLYSSAAEVLYNTS